MTKLEKKVMNVGPGGLGCACCAPAPGTKERRKMVRKARRRVKQLLLEEGLTEVVGASEWVG